MRLLKALYWNSKQHRKTLKTVDTLLLSWQAFKNPLATRFEFFCFAHPYLGLYFCAVIQTSLHCFKQYFVVYFLLSLVASSRWQNSTTQLWLVKQILRCFCNLMPKNVNFDFLWEKIFLYIHISCNIPRSEGKPIDNSVRVVLV